MSRKSLLLVAGFLAATSTAQAVGGGGVFQSSYIDQPSSSTLNLPGRRAPSQPQAFPPNPTAPSQPATANPSGQPPLLPATTSQFQVVQSTMIAALGTPVSVTGGPWVVGDVLFFSSGAPITNFGWKAKVKASLGALYTKNDMSEDVQSLMSLGEFTNVSPAIYSMANIPVPAQYSTISSEPNQVRLVFNVAEKYPQGAGAPRQPSGPAPVSGIIFTPTAYRGRDLDNEPGLGLDINAIYIIGRLYGKNGFANSPDKTNYLDRVGVWLLSADGKMQVQSETKIRPAMAFGAQGTFMFRDQPQPPINTSAGTTVTVNSKGKSTQALGDIYGVASKKFGPVRASVGLMEGDIGNTVAQFSEFLSPASLVTYANMPGQAVTSRTMPFASLLVMPKPSQPLGIEFIQFNGAALHPFLVNLKIGYFLHLNFDIGYLHFDHGYDILGLIQFRYNYFPR